MTNIGNGNVVISGNKMNLQGARVTELYGVPGYEAGNLMSPHLHERWRGEEDELVGVLMRLELPDNYPINFVGIVGHNFSPNNITTVEPVLPSMIPNPAISRQEAWGFEQGGAEISEQGGVTFGGTGQVLMVPRIVYNAGYKPEITLNKGVFYTLRTEVDAWSGGLLSIQLNSPDLLIGGVPQSSYQLSSSGGVTEKSITIAPGGPDTVVISLKISASAALETTMRRIELTPDPPVIPPAQVQRDGRYYPDGTPWDAQVSDGRAPAWARTSKVGIIHHTFGFPRVTSAVVVKIEDPENYYNYLEAARVVVGVAVQPSINFDKEWQLTSRDTSQKTRNPITGDLWVSKGAVYRELQLKLSNITDPEAVMLAEMFEEVGESGDVVVLPFPAAPSVCGVRAVYGVLSGPHTVASKSGELYSANIKVEEYGGF